jgi:hypothetical protein
MSAVGMRAWLASESGHTEAARAAGAHYLIVVAPTKETVLPQHAPAWFGGVSPNRPALALSRLAAEAQAVDVFYPYPRSRPLRRRDSRPSAVMTPIGPATEPTQATSD